MCKFNLSQNEKTFEIAKAEPIWTKDPFMRIKKDVGVPPVQFVHAEAGDEEEEEEKILS